MSSLPSFYSMKLFLNTLIIEWQNGSGHLSYWIVFSNNMKMFLASLTSWSIVTPNSLLLQWRTLLIFTHYTWPLPFHKDNCSTTWTYETHLYPPTHNTFATFSSHLGLALCNVLDNAIPRIIPVSKTFNSLLVISLWLVSCYPL